MIIKMIIVDFQTNFQVGQFHLHEIWTQDLFKVDSIINHKVTLNYMK
jgi:hypothetical protein